MRQTGFVWPCERAQRRAREPRVVYILCHAPRGLWLLYLPLPWLYNTLMEIQLLLVAADVRPKVRNQPSAPACAHALVYSWRLQWSRLWNLEVPTLVIHLGILWPLDSVAVGPKGKLLFCLVSLCWCSLHVTHSECKVACSRHAAGEQQASSRCGAYVP